ncbi:MAG: hypothetical protein JEZ12_04985 [Desulfobacterium sp.]|nr:hypothetical protein [Desulfobacterium sp.]
MWSGNGTSLDRNNLLCETIEKIVSLGVNLGMVKTGAIGRKSEEFEEKYFSRFLVLLLE